MSYEKRYNALYTDVMASITALAEKEKAKHPMHSDTKDFIEISGFHLTMDNGRLATHMNGQIIMDEDGLQYSAWDADMETLCQIADKESK